jgi:hypothetical protein
MRTLFLLLLASTAWATPNWHRVQPDGSLACSTAYATAEFCGADCQAREHDQDCEVLALTDVEESYQEENPEWRRQLEQLQRDGHLDDGSTVTTAPPFITRTRMVRKLMVDAAKKAAKDAREAAENSRKQAAADRKVARATRAAILKGKTLSSAERKELDQLVIEELFEN